MIIDPNSSGGVGKGRKVFHGVGLRRWESSTGTPILDIGLVVLKDMEGDGNENLQCRARFFLTANAGWRLGNFAKACGHGEPFDAFDDAAIAKFMAKGPMIATVEMEEYQGNSYPRPGKWASYSGAEDPEWAEMIQNAEAKFAEWVEKQEEEHGGSSSSGSSSGCSSSSGGSTGGGGGPDSDIPF